MISVWAAPALAGAWSKAPGELYAKVGADFYSAVRYVAPGETTGPAESETLGYLGQQYGIYAEAGVLPGWRGQVSLSLPLVGGTRHGAHEDAFGSTEVRATAFRSGDLRMALQTALHRRLPLALAVDLKVPTYDNGTVGQRYPVYRELFPKPGDGQVDVGAMLYAGLSPWEGAFAEAGLGFVHRTERFVGGTSVGWPPELALSDGFRCSTKVGHAFGRFLPILAAEATLSPQPTRYTRSSVSVSLSALIDVAEGVALEPRIAGEVWARNASQGFGGGLGLSIRR